MNKKGQIPGLGLFLVAFIAIVVGLAFWQPLADNMGKTTNTFTSTNETVLVSSTVPGTLLKGQGIVGTPIIVNATGQVLVENANFTFSEAIDPSSGYVRNYITNSSLGANQADQSYNITYTYEPEGYVADAGSRSVILMIMIFFALGIAIIALVPTLRSGLLDYIR